MAATNDIYVDGIAPACNAEALNGFNRENNFLISSAGMTLSTADNLQTSKAVSTYSTRGDFYIEDGTSAPDAYVLVSAGTQQEVPQLQDGMKFRFEVVNTNTGASSLDIDGLGAKVINYGGSVLQAGMLTAGNTVSVVFNNSANRFDLEYSLDSFSLFVDPTNEDVNILGQKKLILNYFGGGNNYIYCPDASISRMGFFTAALERLSISYGGNVGIGTTNPVGNLEVKSASNLNAFRILSNDNELVFNFGISATDDGIFNMYSDGILNKVRLDSNGDSFFTGGNVGIGTTSPEKPLHIKSDVDNSFLIESNDSGAGLLLKDNSSSGLSGISVIADDIFLQSSSTVRLFINSTGDIGVGTTLPERKLDVIGDITPPQNYITGFVPSNGADADHDLDIGIGICKDATNIQTIELTSVLTKQIDAVFAEGTSQGGLAASLTLTGNTTYHLFIIKKADGTTDAYYDDNGTANNMPTGFIYYRRIYSLYTDASANIRAIKTKDYGGGKIMTFMQPVQDYSGAPPTIATNVSLTVPEGIEVEARCSFVINGATATSLAVYGSHPSLTPTASSFSTFIFAGTAGEIFDEGSSGIVLTNTSRQISVIASAASGTLIIGTQGFLDFRG